MNTPSRQTLFFGAITLSFLLLSGCAIPRHIWPQKDITASGEAFTGDRKILIASRSSEYKKQLVAALQKQLSDLQISHQTIGIDQLKNTDSSGYAAVVIINTCLARGLDPKIERVLNSRKTTSNIILLTTSGEGSWLPDKNGRDFDAISGASEVSNIDDVVGNLVGKIRRRL